MVAQRREKAKTSRSERPRRRHLDDGSFARLPPVQWKFPKGTTTVHYFWSFDCGLVLLVVPNCHQNFGCTADHTALMYTAIHGLLVRLTLAVLRDLARSALNQESLKQSCFAHYDLVTRYDDLELGWCWLRWWVVAGRHQTISWTNVDASLIRSDNYLRAISHEVLQPPITKISLKITSLNFIQISQEPMI